MTAAEAILYLRERVRVQREEKTSYNRLRWCSRDLAAVQAVIAELANITATEEETNVEEPGTEEPVGTRRYVIEISVIANADSDADAEHIGQAVRDALRTPVARAKAAVHPSVVQRDLARIEEITVANVDGDFLAATV